MLKRGGRKCQQQQQQQQLLLQQQQQPQQQQQQWPFPLIMAEETGQVTSWQQKYCFKF
jgi:hypothetical protein